MRTPICHRPAEDGPVVSLLAIRQAARRREVKMASTLASWMARNKFVLPTSALMLKRSYCN